MQPPTHWGVDACRKHAINQRVSYFSELINILSCVFVAHGTERTPGSLPCTCLAWSNLPRRGRALLATWTLSSWMKDSGHPLQCQPLETCVVGYGTAVHKIDVHYTYCNASEREFKEVVTSKHNTTQNKNVDLDKFNGCMNHVLLARVYLIKDTSHKTHRSSVTYYTLGPRFRSSLRRTPEHSAWKTIALFTLKKSE